MRVFIGLVGSFVFMTALCGAAAASEQARAKYEEGVTAFEAQRYTEAAAAFRAAYALKPAWKLKFNIGQCEAAAKRYGLALEAFEDYLSEGGDELSTERRETVLAEVERLRKMTGFIKVVAPAGAVIAVDGMPRGTAPLPGELPVAIGPRHTVTAQLDGESLGERTVKVYGGKTASVEFGVEPHPAPAQPRDEQPEEEASADEPAEAQVNDPVEDERDPLKTAGWVSLGTGAALIVGGIITGSAALSIDKELESECDGITCPEGREDRVDRMNGLGVATDVMLGVGIAAAATGVVLLFVAKARDGEEEDPSDTDVTVGPSLGPGIAGAAIQGRF